MLLIGYIDGLRIRYRYPSGSVAGQPRRTLTGWTSTDEAGRRRLRRLNNLWSQYRIPPPRSRQYPGKCLSDTAILIAWVGEGGGQVFFTLFNLTTSHNCNAYAFMIKLLLLSFVVILWILCSVK